MSPGSSLNFFLAALLACCSAAAPMSVKEVNGTLLVTTADSPIVLRVASSPLSISVVEGSEVLIATAAGRAALRFGQWKARRPRTFGTILTASR
jgi:hypothetical protein